MEGVTKIVMYLIPIIMFVLLVMYFFAPSGGVFEKFKDAGGKVKEYLPTIGAEKLQGEKVDVSGEHRGEILSLKNTIENMKGKGPCFARYKQFSDLGEEGVTISLNYNGKGGSDFIVTTGKQIVSDLSFTINEVSPCVIAGGKVVEAFGLHYINDKQWKDKPIITNDYASVNQIIISYSANNFNGNIIRVPELGADIVNGVSNNLKDAGVLYTPDGKNICFFPTVTFGSDKDGLSENYLGVNKGMMAIPRQMEIKRLRVCSE
ncbi:hypothetical protein HYX11_02305 [Candidatus Woesearchaeota archaeon]|nr:hypothetical protein [Candidatus Woesearchaeota archaeon]